MPDSTVVRHGTDSSGRPIYMTAYMQAWWDAFAAACAAKGFEPAIVQGAFMTKVAGGGADASAGYHDLGGCLDLRVWDRTPDQVAFMVREGRRRGAATWVRDKTHGGMDPHLHLLLGGDRPLAQGASDQWLDYLDDGNGLTGTSAGRDYHWRPSPLVTNWSPEPVVKPTPNITAALAETGEARKRALRQVIAHGSPAARKAAKAWLAAILGGEAAKQKARVARGDLRDLEVR